jgi:hypothetical protein
MTAWAGGVVLASIITTTAGSVRAQEMVEIAPDPVLRARVEAARLVPAPSPSESIPEPVVAPLPDVPRRTWRYERQLDLMWSGVGMSSGAYTVTALIGAGLRKPALAIPIAGPIVGVGGFPPAYYVAFLDMAVQATGIVVAVVAPFTRRIHWHPVASR